ncbi:hypothetical protein AW736_09735 [Termitidicoccus mucosus]|uniref:Cytochrome oxidase subunit I profile domain-containing protein n=2 Tax=Termitidicoccus mucosus TaxID=1184151 RepID=A0A178ILB0_9BACT|nr:hypothetical protein AW736_09735 [Opitutaceae bacterium TSB47]
MTAAARRPASPSVPLVGGARLPLAFIACGLAAFAIEAGWLAIEPSLLSLPYLHPRLVALVHVWLPGFLLSISIGALYQLMPVVLGAPLRVAARWLWWHLGLHAVGMTGLAGGFMRAQFGWVAAGGGLVAIGVGIMIVAVWRTFFAASRRDAAAWSFPLAASWLGATVLLGVTLALARRWSWASLPVPVTDLLRAHAHLGLAGFFLTLLQGTTFQLVPMFTMGEVRRPRFVWAGLLATQAGLLLLAPGLAWRMECLGRLGALVLAGGMACSGLALRATLASRKRRVLEPGIRAFVTGAGLLAAAAMGGVALVFLPGGTEWTMRAISAYGVLAIIGGLGFTVLGMLCKIVPFLVWMRVYGPRVGRQPVPVATSLSSRKCEKGWHAAHLAGVVLLVAGVLAGSPPVVMAGGLALAAGAGLFLASILRVIIHLWRPQMPATAAVRMPVSLS